MRWDDEAIILSVKKFSERDGLVTVFTPSRGLCRGMVRGIHGKRQRGVCLPGNLVHARWNARLAEHLGTLSCELTQPYAALLMRDAGALAGLGSMSALLAGALHEHDPHPALYARAKCVLHAIEACLATAAHPLGERKQERHTPSSPLRGEVGLRSEPGGGEKRFTQQTREYARELRNNLTDAEKKLWYFLRKKHVEGFRFRRQQPIGPYIADFLSFDAKLIIEVDGGQHDERRRYDRRRDTFLHEEGYHVLRFWNHEVMGNVDGVLQEIHTFLISCPHPHPSACGGVPPPSRGRKLSAAPPSSPLRGEVGLRSEPGVSEYAWLAAYALFERDLLAESGFGLDLSACAATGETRELMYISPKSGRAVCREAGAAYHDKLFLLPQFFLREENTPKPAQILDALRVTGYFLERWLFAPRHRVLPEARGRLVGMVAMRSVNDTREIYA